MAADMSLEDVGERLRVTRGFVHQVETGRRAAPRDFVRHAARIFGGSPDVLCLWAGHLPGHVATLLEYEPDLVLKIAEASRKKRRRRR